MASLLMHCQCNLLLSAIMISFKVAKSWTFQNCGEFVVDKPAIILNLIKFSNTTLHHYLLNNCLYHEVVVIIKWILFCECVYRKYIKKTYKPSRKFSSILTLICSDSVSNYKLYYVNKRKFNLINMEVSHFQVENITQSQKLVK